MVQGEACNKPRRKRSIGDLVPFLGAVSISSRASFAQVSAGYAELTLDEDDAGSSNSDDGSDKDDDVAGDAE